MSKRELMKKVAVLKQMEEYTDLAGIEVDNQMKNVLEYLYSHQNKNGYVYISIRDLVLECDLGSHSKTKEDLLNNIKHLLCDLEEVVLEEFSAKQIQSTTSLDELLILELLPEFK